MPTLLPIFVEMEANEKLSHIDQDGQLNMVDVGHKPATLRTAKAMCKVEMPEEIYHQLAANAHRSAKGQIMDTAILAGIMAAKRTSELIPLCHPLPLHKIDIQIQPQSSGFQILSEVRTTHQTGVEMEALVAASTAALTIYDMCKALSHEIRIEQLQLVQKTGGKKDYQRL
jgi:cyclic pyranopterin monophosphate synthase